jgi:glycosidase
MEFHISREARDHYEFDEGLFSQSGNVILANFHAARMFAQKMNDKRDLVSYPEQAVKAGQINAMGLIDELSHLMIQRYREQQNPAVMELALEWLYDTLGQGSTDTVLRRFADEFPPLAVYRHEIGVEEYLQGETNGVPHRQLILEEMLMLWLANVNSAFAPFLELFDDDDLARDTAYPQALEELANFFETQPPFGSDNQSLITFLRAPALAHPHSLSAQLEYIRERWGTILGSYLYRLLSSLDLIQEEDKAVFFGPGPSLVYEYGAIEFEPEQFSPDQDWMPRAVLMAKNTYVWLHQLSEKYNRSITQLDQIPDEELDTLARWGITGLWFIGLWERSPASSKIKQLCGNPEAVASAYSLYDYQIAADLGGTKAYESLRDRAWQRGIRLASDMVPNHVGIYSRWVVEHPDWFISLPYSPFPSYSFTGPDLSEDERVGIYIEDHYYDRTDAAVVFKRVDRWTGDERFIYHGNDGTSMPWNDTAQLNFLHPEVREAVIQTILHVARQFPIIRFDAAMTLAKKHFQRLWFPEPGSGGAIPTRAEHGMTRAQFDEAMPVEFWREVVDRVAEEAPDTLLLAEAFWLLEGYFVRTLGMHRVYNSAFMNMLRDEDNAKYRSVMKNTLEFDPEILKRFVSFMNNPDEETAVAQFGKGDKYFGICTMMATLPGLPMFGHGQVEGLAEKYGMEYRRAYWDEQADSWLVERHEREIFPLLHRRDIFAEVSDFLLYDFFAAEGHVNEDVFAYSNRSAATGARALVVYHNKFATAQGWVKSSVAFSVKSGDDGDRVLIQRSLGDGLGLRDEPGYFCIFRDHITGLEYIRSSQELCQRGLYIELGAYKCHVFLDWREVADNEWGQYAHLAAYLDGRGVPSVEEALREVFLQPVHGPFRALVNADRFRGLLDSRVRKAEGKVDAEVLDQVENRVLHLLEEVQQFAGHPQSTGPQAVAKDVSRTLDAILSLPVLAMRYPLPRSRKYKAAAAMVEARLADDAAWESLLAWLFTHDLGQVVAGDDPGDGLGPAAQSRAWVDEWLLGKLVASTLQNLGLDEQAAWWSVGIVKILISHQDWYKMDIPKSQQAHQVLTAWLRDSEIQQMIQVNRYGGVLWFNQEAFEQLLSWMLTIASVGISADGERKPEEVARDIVACYDVINKLQQAADASEYQVVKLVEAIGG